MVGWTQATGVASYGAIDGSEYDVKFEVEVPATAECRQDKPGRFRYLFALTILLGMMLRTYESNVLAVVAIRMISTDVLDAGLTQIRSSRTALDPLAPRVSNAAIEGTCPLEVTNDFQPNQTSTTVNLTEVSIVQQLAISFESLLLTSEVQSDVAEGKLVNWDVSQRGIIFSAHGIGSLLSSIPLSLLGLAYGNKIIVSVSLLSSALHALLFPLVASNCPFWLTLLFEVITGALGHGLSCVGYPLAGAWLLPSEASAYVVLHQMSSLVGTTLSHYVSAQLVTWLGWSACFHLTAVPLVLLLIVWLVLGADKPTESRFVSQAELAMLETGSLANTKRTELYSLLGDVNCRCVNPQLCPAKQQRRTTNWRALICCPTIWAMVLAHFAVTWNAGVANMWPTYFANILHFKPAFIGQLELAKGILTLIMGLFFGWLSSKRIERCPFNISLTAIRRLNHLIATCVLAISIFLFTYLDCNLIASVTSVLLIPIVSCFNIISYLQLPLDISPEESGLIIGYMMTLGMGSQLGLPVSTQILAADANPQVGSRHTWSIVWNLGLGIKAVACLFFITQARAEPKSYTRLEPAGPCTSTDTKRIDG